MDATRAVIELALARVRLRKADICNMVTDPPQRDRPLTERQEARVRRIGYLIPRMAARMPWRADCLVQATAARNWLRRSGIASQIRLGVRRSPAAEMEAHAWLLVGQRVVTGGDISTYSPLVRNPPKTPR